tara:strand:- start:139 stop:1335 length:1197 start_codon:yes stop_codon:yes gene_type:complete
MNKKKLVLILLPHKFKNHYLYRFNVNEFISEKNINVEIHQLIDFINPKFKKAFQRNDNHKNLKIFKTYKTWKWRMKNLKKKYGKEIIIINTIQNISLISFKINFFIKKNEYKTLDYLYKFSLANTPYKKHNLKELLKIFFFNQKKIYNFFKIKFFLYLGELFNLYPDYSIKTGQFPNINKNKNTKIIYGNSDDFNVFLSQKKNNINIKKFKKFGLFLEAPTPLFDGDTFITKDDPEIFGDRKKWIERLNIFFNFLEKDLKILIKIAPHPKVFHKNRFPDYYFGREIVKFNLNDIARHSKLFISRSSTAMGYAVIHNKPSLFLTTNKIIQGPKYKYQKIISSEFGTKPINIDLNINSFQLHKALKINKRKYEKYKQQYLTSRLDKKNNFHLIKGLFKNL